MRKHRTIDGDMLDWVCWRTYSRESGSVEAVLEANYRLSDQPEKMPAGVEIELPEFTVATRIVRLWD